MSRFSRSLKTAFVAVASLVCITSCTNQSKTQKVLEKMNYKIVSYEGHAWFDGGKDDYADEYRVVPPGGKDTVSVVVSGNYIGKSPTIRIK